MHNENDSKETPQKKKKKERNTTEKNLTTMDFR